MHAATAEPRIFIWPKYLTSPIAASIRSKYLAHYVMPTTVGVRLWFPQICAASITPECDRWQAGLSDSQSISLSLDGHLLLRPKQAVGHFKWLVCPPWSN